LAGFAVGIVEKSKIIDGSKSRRGQINRTCVIRYSQQWIFPCKEDFGAYCEKLAEEIKMLGTTLGEELIKPQDCMSRRSWI